MAGDLSSVVELSAPVILRRRPMVLITGGSGFLGANLADRLAAAGEHIPIYDNLSRPGVVKKIAWLQHRHGHRIETAIADVRDEAALAGDDAPGERSLQSSGPVRGREQHRRSGRRLRNQRPLAPERAGGGLRSSGSATPGVRIHQQGLRRAL